MLSITRAPAVPRKPTLAILSNIAALLLYLLCSLAAFELRRRVADPVAGILEADLDGDLAGRIRWTIRGTSDGCLVTFDEDVVTNKASLNVLAPVARPLDRGRADVWLLYLQVFACFVGLATLPFTRFYHALAAPVSLLVNGVAPSRELSAAGRASRRALALDACVRCGICDLRCSVAPIARYLGNPGLLPAHKLITTGALAGGLYGVSLGRTFFGESMFSMLPNASKAALITLVGCLRERGFDLIDCQVETSHLGRLGAHPIPRRQFHARLQKSLRHETLRGSWGRLL